MDDTGWKSRGRTPAPGSESTSIWLNMPGAITSSVTVPAVELAVDYIRSSNSVDGATAYWAVSCRESSSGDGELFCFFLRGPPRLLGRYEHFRSLATH